MQDDVTRLRNELGSEKETARNCLVKLRQIERREKSSETKLQMAEKVVDQRREENVRAHLQVERLSKRNRSSEKDAKKALSALRKWGRVS